MIKRIPTSTEIHRNLEESLSRLEQRIAIVIDERRIPSWNAGWSDSLEGSFTIIDMGIAKPKPKIKVKKTEDILKKWI